MRVVGLFSLAFFLVAGLTAGCGSALPGATSPQGLATPSVQPTALEPSAGATPAGSTVPTTRPTRSSPEPSPASLELEVVQSQIWADYQGNARANVLFSNPYDFPVQVKTGSHANLYNAAGDLLKSGHLYFLDGVSGGTGFITPGDTVAANSCFTCEQALLAEPWATITFVTYIQDATEQWDYSTDVEASAIDITYDEDSPIFWAEGKLTNTSGATLDRISIRILAFVDGTLIGAAAIFEDSVGPGVTVDFSGYGLGENPPGDSSANADYEISTIGVNF